MTSRRSPCRVAYITQWFEPEPVFKGAVFAKALAARGFDVEVITGFPNYPSGKLFPGYRLRVIQREVINGIPVVRLPLYPSHDHSAFRRVLNYASFSLSVMIFGLFFMRRSDVMYVYHPPLTVGVAASVIRLFRRIPFVYDVQDLWPDTLSATGMINSRPLLALVGLLCKAVYQMADRIAVLSPGFKSALVDRGVPASKISVVVNWADEAALTKECPRKDEVVANSASFDVVFAGNMGRAQGLESILEAAVLLERQGSAARFILVGQGVERQRLEQLALTSGLRNVIFVDPVPISEIGDILRAARALLVHLKPDPLFDITIPSKTQAYMAVGRPVIMAVRGDAARLIEASGGGVVAEPGNPESIASAVRHLESMLPSDRDAMGVRARVFYDERLSMSHGVERVSELLRGASGV
jgi:glycosyltransferase involved in cell wall biosynthesis